MSPQNDITTSSGQKDVESPASVPDTQPLARAKEQIEIPSADNVLSELSTSAPSIATVRSEPLDSEEQRKMFRSLQALLNNEIADEARESFDLKDLQTSLVQADADAKNGLRDVNALERVRVILDKLWQCGSGYMIHAAEILANGSRDPSWRAPYGQAGILDFFLQLVASKDHVDKDVLLHSLRLIGNSCADTDENREIIVRHNYTLAIVRHFLNPELIHVAIPVIYNICMDYEPAQSQTATNRVAYILLKLIKDGAVKGSALLNFAYELIEMASEQEQGIDRSPDGTILLLMELAIDEKTDLAQFSCLVSCLATYLENKRFQDVCVSKGMVEGLLSVLSRSFSIDVDQSSNEDTQSLAQVRIKINQTLAEVSASPLFMGYYPLSSPLPQTLKSWLTMGEEQLQICSCVMLGNLARSDEVCRVMVQDMNVHKELITVLKSGARGVVLHAALGFLKNLAIAGDNRSYLGDAGIIPAISSLWGFETVPQVQFSAVSLARQVIISSVENIARLLEPLSFDPDSPAHMRTYLSLLLSLFEKTDSTPIKTEIGRTVASICRTIINPRAHEDSGEANALFERFFSLHKGIARPLGAMITQTQWPVVRSEGLFALALMASSKQGSMAVVDCLQNTDVYQLLKDTLNAEVTDLTEETDKVRIAKDRENTIVLVKELSNNELSQPDSLPPSCKPMIEDLMNDHVAKHLKK